MAIVGARALATTALLMIAGHAAAQASFRASASEQSANAMPPPSAWPELRANTTQTWVGIRHNNTDGTVVGLGLRSAAYPSFLLELEVVPPGYGPAEPDKQSAPPALPTDSPQLRNVHKLSLRYRF